MSDLNAIGLLNLPTEILTMIVSFVDFTDKVSVSKVCQVLDSVVHGRALNRCVDLQRSYELNFKDAVLYMNDKRTMSFIKCVNLTSCYWILSVDIKSALINLKNLETFHALDTKLSPHDLETLLTYLPKVNDIAFSWMGPIGFTNGLPNLRSIYIYVPLQGYEFLADIFEFLLLCKNIEKLSIWKGPLKCSGISIEDAARIDAEELKLTKLNSLLLKLSPGAYKRFCVTTFITKIISASVDREDWEKYWILHKAPIVSLPRAKTVCIRESIVMDDNLKNVERAYITRDFYPLFCYKRPHEKDSFLNAILTRLRSLAIFVEAVRDFTLADILREGNQLEELNIYGRWLPSLEQLQTFCQCLSSTVASHRLTKLSLPACFLRRKHEPSHSKIGTIKVFGQRPRVSHVETSATCSPFETVVSLCPNIEEFEIGVEIKTEIDMSVLLAGIKCDSVQLVLIANWKHLKKLTINCIPVTSWTFIEEIAQNCPNLTSLTLRFLHFSAASLNTSELIEALPSFAKIEDLVLRLPSATCSVSVLQALRQETLQRVTLQCDVAYRVCVDAIEQFLAECHKVIFFFFSANVLMTEARQWETYLQQRFADRQAPILTIVPTYRFLDCCKSLPAIHLNEMIYCGSRVATLPHSGPTHIYCY